MTNHRKPSDAEGKDMDLNEEADTNSMTGRGQQNYESSSSHGRLDPRVRSHIGRKIKAVYDEVLEEPVPDRFLTLLDELAKKERESE